jgi:hypothetical protein
MSTRSLGLAIALLLAGCGSGTIGSGTNQDGFNVAPGSSVLVDGITQVTFSSTGGGLESLPSGAPCDPGIFVYAIDFTAHNLSTNACIVNNGDWTDPANFTPQSGVTALDATQWANVEAAIAAVTVTDGTDCGADAPSRNLAVAKSTASITYGDDFYGCEKLFAHYVSSDDLYHLSAALSAIP